MQIIDFSKDLIPAAIRLIWENYEDERAVVSTLPDLDTMPPLDELAENGLGAAAVESGVFLGFLSAYGPWGPVFTTQANGVFSPIHAHAAQKEKRVAIYQRLYQAAGEKWMRAGAASHAVALFAHDTDAQTAFYFNGFGMRCMDLIRPMTPIAADITSCCAFLELPDSRFREVHPLRLALSEHLSHSPGFMYTLPEYAEDWLRRKEAAKPRVFIAEDDGRIVAYLEVDAEGENFATYAEGMQNICGAYCLPEYRGTGTIQGVLNLLISTLRAEGNTRLGVDCESINPTASHFWPKYFDVYTHSVVRRIDENILNR